MPDDSDRDDTVRGFGVPTDADPDEMSDAVDEQDGIDGREAYTSERTTTYVGLFGGLCQHIPLIDATAPPGWTLVFRSWNRTIWHHPDVGAVIRCRKGDDGWEIHVHEHFSQPAKQVLPRNATRWRAFGAVRSFFDGEPLMIADPHPTEDGLLTQDQLHDS